jgi:transcriptional regulator with XRE-family HTH domain
MADAEQSGRRRAKGVPQEELEREYPSLSFLAGPTSRATRRAWVAVFNSRPDAMHSLLADYIKQVHARPGRIGQRPMPKEEQVDFQTLLYGEQNDLPLTEILPKVITKSERAMCAEIHMSRAQYQRMLKGEYDPDVNELRTLAAALGKPPTFFVEYRKAMVMAAMLNLLDERPGIATSLYRKYLEVRL